MSTPWVIAFCVLTATMIALGLVLLGLATRVSATCQRIEAALTRRVTQYDLFPDAFSVGDLAPQLPAPLAESKDSPGTIVLFLEHGCEPCQVLAYELTRRPARIPDHRLVLIIDDQSLLDDRSCPDWQAVLDPDHRWSHRWQVTGTPTAFVVGSHGRVTATGHPNTLAALRRLTKTPTEGRIGIPISHRETATHHPEREEVKHDH